MRKLIILLICLLTLSGCSQIEDDIIQNQIATAIDDAIAFDVVSPEKNTATKEYYSYYLYTGVSIEASDSTSNTFKIDETTAVLNLDIAGLNAKKYYLEHGDNELILRAVETLENPWFIRSGQYQNSSNERRVYRIFINKMNEKIYYVFLQTNEFLFSCFTYETSIDRVCFEMLKLIRTCVVDADKVIDDYSLVRQEEYTISSVDIFTNTMPESGYIEDYLDTWRENPAFNLIEPE